MNMLKVIFIFYALCFFSHGEKLLHPETTILSKNEDSFFKSQKVKQKKELAVNQKIHSSSEPEAQSELPKDYLIEKLNNLTTTLPKNHKAIPALNLRLAHVLTLKAEENFIKTEKENCKACREVAQSSAIRALSAYEKVNPFLENRHSLLHTEALFKQAYLHRFLGEKTKALNKLKKIVVKKTIDPALIKRAWFNIAEIHFELYDYEKSLQACNEVLKQEKSPWRFRAFYRKIWSLYNLSLYEESINELVSFLKSDLYSSPRLNKEEKQLKQKLEGELIALYNYAKVTNKKLSFLYNFSKQNQNKNTLPEKNKRLFDLAQALNKIGRMSDSNKVWQMYLLKTVSLNKKLKAQIFMLSNDLNLNKKNLLQDTGQKLEKIFALQEKVEMEDQDKKVEISEELKESIKKKSKRFFSQVRQKVSLSDNQRQYLLVLYQKYNSIYPEDTDTSSLSAFLARDLKKYGLAQELFQKAVLSMNLHTNKKALRKDIKENMSLLQMEMAELTKDKTRRLNAYDFYIQHGDNKGSMFKVKYQKAYISYENKEYQKSNESFKVLALYENKKTNPDIHDLSLKAAHLSLSSLDQIGNQEEELAHRAGLFMKEFPQNREEFIRIHHSALLNTVKKLLSDKDLSSHPVQASSDKNILKAWDTLHLISLKEATKEEALSFHFDRLLLAKELFKFEEMDQSLQALSSDKSLKKEDQKIALTWKLWLAELRFDFKEVLKIIKILQPKNQTEEHLLRLARLTELTGKNPVPYYKLLIEKFPNSPSATTVLTSMIEKASHANKKSFLQKYSSLFKNQPNTLTYLILKADAGKLDENFIKPFVSLSFMQNSPLVSFLKRKELIESFEKELSKIRNYSLPHRSSGYRLTKSIKNYNNKIDQLNNKAEEALKTEDWTARVFIISHWEKEISRFYQSVMNLPLPKGLTEEEQKQYTTLLQEQLKTYKEQISQLQNALHSLWSRDFLTDYKKGIKQDKVFYAPLKWEMEKVLTVSDEETKKTIQFLLSSLETQSSSEKLTQEKTIQTQHLYKALQRNPFDKNSLTKLLELEQTRKNEALSHYLADRINELNKKGQKIKL